VLKMSQDAWQGNAQYTVSVDGKQVGGTYTAHAAHSAGATETVTLHGNWGAGDHTVSVAFLNDAYGGAAGADRNLYLDGATYNGEAVAGAKATLASAGAATFAMHDATPTTTPATPDTTPATPDTLVLKMSQDAWQGNAQYTVSVDGKQVGGTYTAHAAHSAGATENVTLHGNWGAGDHTVSVAFLNDAYGGTDAQDRNLYLDGATYNGEAVAGAKATFANAGAASFGVQDATPATTPATPDTLVLKMSQDAWQGNAQYTVSVDGKQVGGTYTAHAAHSAGATEAVTLHGNWGPGDHTVSVAFLNDAYGGAVGADRNLYLDGATYNGADIAGAEAVLVNAGAASFAMHDNVW
jgi:hypothetical protein